MDQICIVLFNPQKAKKYNFHLGEIANTVLVGFRYAFVRGYYAMRLCYFWVFSY